MVKTKTKIIAFIGVMSALSIVLALLIHIPIIPAAPFLEYDPADIPIFICTILFGPVVGIIQTVIVSVLQGLTVSSSSGLYGILMHVIATGTYTMALGLLTFKKNSDKKILTGMTVGIICWVLVMIPANLIVTPAFTGMPASVVMSDFMIWIVLFNIIKSIANSIFSFVIYKAIKRLLRKYIKINDNIDE